MSGNDKLIVFLKNLVNSLIRQETPLISEAGLQITQDFLVNPLSIDYGPVFPFIDCSSAYPEASCKL